MIRDVVEERIKNATITKSNIQKQLIFNTIDDFLHLFDTIDVEFSHLCILDPTTQEKKETTDAINVLKSIWHNMNLNVTPKAHILFDHTMTQVHLLGGIADLAEDFVEKAHQTGKKLDHLVARMP